MDNRRMLWCKRCRNIFKSVMSEETVCPGCSSSEVEEAPAWAPVDAGDNIYQEDVWEYKCQECQNCFKMPIPKSPTEDKGRRCPACGASHLHRLSITGGQPLYCG